jgi:hypothetical protein
MTNTQPTETFSEWKKRVFPNARFRKDHLKLAGKVFKKSGADEAAKYLADKQTVAPADFQPPAKCHVVCTSRPYEEFSISKASLNIQTFIYGLTVSEIEALKPGTSKEAHQSWFQKTGVDNCGYTSVQGLNLIFQHTMGRFAGVILKVDNRNEKKKKKIEKVNKKRREDGLAELPLELEVATDEAGHLLQPPGINHSIYCCQQVSPKIYNAAKFPQVALPKEYEGYSLDPELPIPKGIENRLDITKGSPGYVPEHQRGGLSPNKHKRIRQPFAFTKVKDKPNRTSKFDPVRYAKEKAKGAILGIIKFDKDWVVFDMRGLLRNVHWRGLATENMSPIDLLSFFTGDPVIDPKRNIITFTYKPGKVSVHSLQKPITGKRTKAVLETLTEPKNDKANEVAVLSIDLGQTNPVAVGMYRVGRNDNGTLEETLVHRDFLSNELLKELSAYRVRHDLLEEQLRRTAILGLTKEQQEEIAGLEEASADSTKTKMCEDLGINSAELPWNEMSARTTFISDYILAHGGEPEKVIFESKDKKGKVKKHKRRDNGWAYIYRPKLSKETREAKDDLLWKLKREADDYKRLSKRKEEVCRRIVNYFVRDIKKRTQCSQVVILLEDLNIMNFHGGGRRDVGWDNFFVVKRENRWFIQALHKAFSQLGVHRGIPVMEVHPARTSITCPSCRHCEKDNRDGEKFECLKCGKTYHADLEVATSNLMWVALNGQAMPKGESLRAEKTPIPSRKRKTSKEKEKTEETPETPATPGSTEATARKSIDNAA